MVYVSGVFVYIECQGVLWGLHCVPFVSLWGALGSLWDALGRHWDALGHTSGHLGLHWGVLGMPGFMPLGFTLAITFRKEDFKLKIFQLPEISSVRES